MLSIKELEEELQSKYRETKSFRAELVRQKVVSLSKYKETLTIQQKLLDRIVHLLKLNYEKAQ